MQATAKGQPTTQTLTLTLALALALTSGTGVAASRCPTTSLARRRVPIHVLMGV